MALASSPSLCISSTSLHLQPHKLVTLFNNRIPTIKYSSLTQHAPQLRLSAASADSFTEEFDKRFDYEEEEEEEEEAAEGSSRLYVGNLPYAMTSSELNDIFAEVGRVASVEIVYDRVTDRSRGFAFVTMQTVDEAKNAIRTFNGAQIGGRSVKVNFPEVPRGGEREVMGPRIRSSYRGFIDSPFKIYAGNLSWRLTSQRLRDAFDDQPGLLSAKVIYERDSARSRGFGFVTFGSMREAQSAADAMNGVEVEGRPLRLNLVTASVSDLQPQETKTETETDDTGNTVQSTITM